MAKIGTKMIANIKGTNNRMEAMSSSVRVWRTWTPVMAEKGGHKHFMHKEIAEQPRAVTDTLRGRLGLDDGDVNLDGVDNAVLARAKALPLRVAAVRRLPRTSSTVPQPPQEGHFPRALGARVPQAVHSKTGLTLAMVSV